ncbi:hypothetical protein B0H11DRAFT_1959743 [Mycena galericulata]|nr:hypothetical protein B0H11DRAFT_1959743 [Mycena galericulata]
MVPHIPPELVDSILSFLHLLPPKYGAGDANCLDDSRTVHLAATVGKCALVCRSWVPPSRRILFYRASIGQSNVDNFVELLSGPQLPSFLSSIRELELGNGDWMNTPALLKVLESLTSIHTVSVVVAPRMIIKSPYRCPSLSAVTRLEIANRWGLCLADTAEWIALFPVLEELKIRLRGWFKKTLPYPALRPAETLHTLQIRTHAVEPFLSWIQASGVVISTLQIYLDTTSTDFQSVVRYIQSLGTSLTVLDLILDHWSRDGSTDLYESLSSHFLSSNTQLRELFIEGLPDQIISILTRIRPISSLERISIAGAYPTLDALSVPPAWSELDRLLTPFISVTRLDITYLTDELAGLRLRIDDISAGIREMLPLCAARGMVTQVLVERNRWLYE